MTLHRQSIPLFAWYLLFLCLPVFFLHFQTGDWWPATLLLYGPRWIWLLPVLLLVPEALFRDRRSRLPLILAAVTVLVPVMGLRLSTPYFATSETIGKDALRVMTYNIGGMRSTGILLRAFREIEPDIALLQERNAHYVDLAFFQGQGWHVHHYHGLDLISRYPVREIDARLPRRVRVNAGSGKVVRYEIDTPSGRINLVNLHLATARDGLLALARRETAGIQELQANIRLRRLESLYALNRVRRGRYPTLVAGDFNMPVESPIYREIWQPSFKNAFSEAGFGFGHTRRLDWYGIRIDHILADSGWLVLRARVGKNQGLDHSPLVADLRLRRRSQAAAPRM